MSFLTDWAAYLPDFIEGFGVTMQLTLFALLIGLPAGSVLALLGLSRNTAIRYTTTAIVEVGRGTPALIVLYLAYYGLPQIGLTLPAFIAAVVGLGFTTAAYSSEIIKGGIKSVDRGQYEAGAALALSPARQMRLIILPQAIKKVGPPLIGLSVLLYQGTSLAYALSVRELLSRAYNIAAVTYEFTSTLMLAGLIYASVSLAGTGLAAAASEGKLAGFKKLNKNIKKENHEVVA